MRLSYPHFPLRRGDIYKIKVPRTEDPTKQELHPVLVLRDERLEEPRASFTIVAYGTSNTKYATHPLALEIDPKTLSLLNLKSTTFFLAHRIHTIDKKKYFEGASYLGRLPVDLMERFDELLVLALQIGAYKVDL
jgi:mRNA-degrading endonuclease toxin of MazEF toxin-antitoxin module